MLQVLRQAPEDLGYGGILLRLQEIHEGGTVIEYGWPPQWVNPPELSEEELSILRRGKTLITGLDLKQWDLFLVDSSVAICIYADPDERWVRLMTDEETAYLKKDMEEKRC